jgi:P27 family predicted phage terminase small subunit
MKIPQHLSKEARTWWKRVTEAWDMDDSGFLVLQTSLESWDEMVDARANLKKFGLLIKNPKTGVLHKNPYVDVLKNARSAFLQSWRMLGTQLEPPAPVGRPPGDKRRFQDEEDL